MSKEGRCVGGRGEIDSGVKMEPDWSDVEGANNQHDRLSPDQQPDLQHLEVELGIVGICWKQAVKMAQNRVN